MIEIASFFLSLTLLNSWVWPDFGAAIPKCALFPSEHVRFGVNVTERYGKQADDYAVDQLHAGWHVSYLTKDAPSTPGGMNYVQLVHGRQYVPGADLSHLQQLVDANPAHVWILGNEPDRNGFQDTQTPAQYAVFYHDVYTLIKQTDPTAQVAIAGIIQPTPIRLRYLQMVLDAYWTKYQAMMPVDIWTFHNFILREERNNWGAELPPGLEEYAAEGIHYELDDHGRIDIFEQQIYTFRRWMADNGYRNRPLVLTEYGILMPPIYDYTDEVVREFMLATFDILRTATDPATGYPADGNRLVQAWGWFSLNEKPYNAQTGSGFNGNLFDHDSGQIESLGQAFSAYTASLVDNFADPLIGSARVRSGPFLTAGVPLTLTVDVVLANGGTQAAENVTVTLWFGTPEDGGTRVDSTPIPLLPPGCRQTHTLAFPWQTDGLNPGAARFVVEASAKGDRRLDNNRAVALLHALPPGADVYQTYLPKAGPWMVTR